jgi:hypothetical protein
VTGYGLEVGIRFVTRAPLSVPLPGSIQPHYQLLTEEPFVKDKTTSSRTVRNLALQEICGIILQIGYSFIIPVSSFIISLPFAALEQI